MDDMRTALLALLVLAVPVAATAQMAPGSIGNGGRMPDTMSPGALPPPPTPPPAPVMAPPPPQPNTQSLARDRIQSQGYTVRRLEQRNDGSWKADATRDAVPTRPRGVPKKVTAHPDGRMTEEW